MENMARGFIYYVENFHSIQKIVIEFLDSEDSIKESEALFKIVRNSQLDLTFIKAFYNFLRTNLQNSKLGK